MHYQKVPKMSESIPYLSVGFDVGTDFTWMFIMLLNGILIGGPLRIIHSDPQSRELATSKIKETQKMYSLESHCFLESIEIYHIPLLCFLRDKGFDCTITNPIIIKSSTNMNVRKLHSDKFDSKKAAKVGLDVSLEASIVPGDAIIDLHNLVRDCYYFKGLQSIIVLKLHAELKVSFPTYLNMFSKAITQTSSELLEAYPLAADMLAAPKDRFAGVIRSTARFGETYAFIRYDAICTTAKDAAVFGCALLSNTLRIRLYIRTYREYQAHLDSILEELHQAVGKLEGMSGYNRISFIQTLHGVGFLSAVVLITEMGSFDLFSSPERFYTYFGLDSGMNDSDKFHGGRVHMSKQDSSFARHTLHMVAIDGPKVDKATKTPMNPIIYDYYTHKCASRKKSVVVGAVMYKICNIIFTMPRDNKSFELTTPEEHHERYTAEHPKFVNTTA